MTEPTLDRAVRINLAYGLTNNLVLRAGSLVLGIVLARLLAPVDFGVFAIALTVQAVLVNITDLGLTAYLVRNGSEIRERAPTVLSMSLLAGGCAAAAMWALAPALANAMGGPEATSAVRVMALTLVLTGLSAPPAAILQHEFRQSRQLLADLAAFVVNVVAVIPMVLAGLGAMSLAWSRVAAQLVAVLMLCVLSGYRPKPGFNLAMARNALRFGLPVGGANLLSWALLNTDYVLVGRFLGPTALGFYVMAFNIASWPTSALAQGLRAVALPAFSRLDRVGADPPVRQRVVANTAALTLGTTVPIGAAIIVLAGPVIDVVYGSRWHPAAGPLAVLGLFGIIRPLFDLWATYLTARGRTVSVLIVQVAWIAALVPALMVGIHLGGTTGAGWAHVAVAVLVVTPAYLVALRRDRIRPSPVLRRMWVPFGTGLVATAVGAAVATLPWNEWYIVLGGGLAVIASYVALTLPWLRGVLRDLRRGPEEPASTDLVMPTREPELADDL
jgi:lipopolysaccharide exporter